MLGFQELTDLMDQMVENLAYDENPKITHDVIEKKVYSFWNKLNTDNKHDLQFILGLKKLESTPKSLINRIKRERSAWLKKVRTLLSKT